MQYKTQVSEDGHESNWLQNMGKDGALMFNCNVDGGAIILTAGWGHINQCPMCGADVTVETEEL